MRRSNRNVAMVMQQEMRVLELNVISIGCKSEGAVQLRSCREVAHHV